MAANLLTQREHLQKQAYGNSDNLQARADIYHYQQPKINLYTWALEQISWQGVQRVLDIGCGPGSYLQLLAGRPELELIGIDLSSGMLRDLRSRWEGRHTLPQLLTGDVQHIALATDSVDVALAMHMLYHVADIPQALRELRRILRPGGRLLALTNSSEHVIEIFRLVADAIDDLAGKAIADRQPVIRRFRLDDAPPLLEAVFEHVERRDVQAELLIPEPEPVIRYINSMRSSREGQLPTGISWDAIIASVSQRVQAEIEAHGVFRVRTHSGVFVCS